MLISELAGSALLIDGIVGPRRVGQPCWLG